MEITEKTKVIFFCIGVLYYFASRYTLEKILKGKITIAIELFIALSTGFIMIFPRLFKRGIPWYVQVICVSIAMAVGTLYFFALKRIHKTLRKIADPDKNNSALYTSANEKNKIDKDKP